MPPLQAVDQLIADAAAGNLAQVTRWLEQVDVNAQNDSGQTALLAASATAKLPIVQLLLSRGANVNLGEGSKSAYTALHAAAEHGHVEVCQVLLDAGANVMAVCGADELMPLHLAAMNGQTAVCEFLLRHGASASARARGFSPLIFAVRNGHEAAARVLLAAGADVTCRTWGMLRTALHFAAERDLPGVVDALLSVGAEVDPRDHNEVTPLHLACERGHEACARRLLQAGADVHLHTRRKGLGGETALHLAAENGHLAVCRLLLEAGADPDARAGVGARYARPAESAAAHGHTAVAALLRTASRSRVSDDARARDLLARRVEEELAAADAAERAARAPRPYVPVSGTEETPLLIGKQAMPPVRRRGCCNGGCTML